jgi:hypothetical protein
MADGTPPHVIGHLENSVADPDPRDPYVFGPRGSRSGTFGTRNGSGSIYNQAKIVRKTLIPTVLRLLYDFYL